MGESLTYLLINLSSISIPFLFSFHPKLRFDRTWFAFFPACFIVGFVFVIWDIWFTQMGVWGFNDRYLIGFSIFNLPIEECLFFLCIPYACLFTYHCLKLLFPKDYLAPYSKGISYVLGVLLMIIGLLHFNRYYTSITFLLTGGSLLYFGLIRKHVLLGRFFFSYLAILPFFFLTNGILTGSGIEEQVVWYNNAENLGTRMGTIPVEDSVYGLLLLWWNVVLYEYFLGRK